MYNKYNIDRILVFAAAFLAAGIFLANYNMLWAIGMTAVLAVVSILLRQKRFFICTGVFTAAVLLIYWTMLPVNLIDKYKGDVTIYGEVVSESSSGYYTTIELAAIDDNIMPINAKIAVSKDYADDNEYPLGAMVCFRGNFYTPSERTNPGRLFLERILALAGSVSVV